MKQPTELFVRHPANPLLTADHWPMPVSAVFNPAACVVDGEVVLVCRVEDTTGISHLWAARSRDGLSSWRVDPEPLLSPRPGIESEQWGFEDARIVRNDELDTWVLDLHRVRATRPGGVPRPTDLRTISPHGLVMPPETRTPPYCPDASEATGCSCTARSPCVPGRRPRSRLSRSSDLDRVASARAGDEHPRRGLVGLGTDRDRPATHRDPGRMAAHLPRRARHRRRRHLTASALPCSTSTHRTG